MRKTPEEAYEDWAGATVMWDGVEYKSRVRWAETKPSTNSDLQWAFCAGWQAALDNLTTRDI